MDQKKKKKGKRSKIRQNFLTYVARSPLSMRIFEKGGEEEEEEGARAGSAIVRVGSSSTRAAGRRKNVN